MQPHYVLDQIANESYALSAAFRRQGEMLAQRVGQTQARWQVLRAASSGSLSVPQIARRLGVTRQNVHRIADGLVSERLAVYVVNQDHKNSPHLLLTERGVRVLEELSSSSADYREQLVGCLAGTDLVRTLASFRSLLAALAKIDVGKVDVQTNVTAGHQQATKIKARQAKRARRS
jgi:DNA-binding MarR family transcriptional regulator